MTDQLDRLTAALADRYKLQRQLGVGGMATVYLAEDLKHKRKVAVKVLRPELAAVLGAERFVQEITTTANLMGDPATDKDRLYRISPLFHADQIKSPLMVLQGANDPRVLQVESDEIVEAIRMRGGVVEYVIFDDEGHGFRKKANRITAYRAIREFLDEYLKGERPKT